MRHGHSFPGKPGCSTVPRSKVHSTDSTTGVQAAGGRVKPLDYLKSSPPQSKEQTTIPNLTPSWKLWWSQTKKSEQLDFSREYEFSDASFHSSSWASKRLSKAIDGLLAKPALTAVSAQGRLGHEVRCYGELSKSEGRDHVSTKPRGLVTSNDYEHRRRERSRWKRSERADSTPDSWVHHWLNHNQGRAMESEPSYLQER